MVDTRGSRNCVTDVMNAGLGWGWVGARDEQRSSLPVWNSGWLVSKGVKEELRVWRVGASTVQHAHCLQYIWGHEQCCCTQCTGHDTGRGGALCKHLNSCGVPQQQQLSQ